MALCLTDDEDWDAPLVIPDRTAGSDRPGTAGCGGCAVRWTGRVTAHCGACHETFSTPDLHAKHRVTDTSTQSGGRCLTPEEMTVHANRNGDLVFRLVDTVWKGPAMEGGFNWGREE